jgi:hypothetical protein
MTSWPNSVASSPVSFSNGSSPVDVDMSMIASKNGRPACPTSQKAQAHDNPGPAESADSVPTGSTGRRDLSRHAPGCDAKSET